MALVDPPSWPGVSHGIHSTRHFSWTAGFPYLSRFDSHADATKLYDINLSSSLEGLHLSDISPLTTLNKFSAEYTAPEEVISSEIAPFDSQTQVDFSKEFPYDDQGSSNRIPRLPFHKWMKTLHRRVSHRGHEESVWPPGAGWQYLESDQAYQRSIHHRFGRRLSSSGSSLSLIAAVKSASISLASGSVVSRSQRRHARSRCRSRAERSSRASLSVPRFSEDSIPLERGKIDVAAMHRSLRRRQILEELISTEEGYIGDIRFLIHVGWSSIP